MFYIKKLSCCFFLIYCLQLDLIYFDNIQKWLDRSDQYCWLQVTYQIGVFISRSSLSLFSTDQIWLMSILQFFNVLFFTYQAIFMVIPNIWIIIGIVFWEGLLGGCCYVNTFFDFFLNVFSTSTVQSILRFFH